MTPQFHAIKPARLAERVERQLRALISAGELRPGDKLPPERDLALRLAVSRTAVREALRTLEQAGLATIRKGPSGGAFIREPDHGLVRTSLSTLVELGRVSMRDLTEARLIIEPMLARLAARRRQRQDLRLLAETIAREEREGVARGSPVHHYHFHRLLAKAARNPVIEDTLNAVIDLLIELLDQAVRKRQDTAHDTTFHKELLGALEERDAEAAERIMRRHIEHVQRRLTRRWQALRARRGDGEAAAGPP